MKTWTEQLLDSEKLWGFLITINNKNEIIEKMIDFKKEDINKKYGIFQDSHIPTLIKL